MEQQLLSLMRKLKPGADLRGRPTDRTELPVVSVAPQEGTGPASQVPVTAAVMGVNRCTPFTVGFQVSTGSGNAG